MRLIMILLKLFLLKLSLLMLVGLMGCATTESGDSKNGFSDTSAAPFDTVDTVSADGGLGSIFYDADDSTDADTVPADCNASASTGLGVGDLIPDMAVQRCDGAWVNLRELICGEAMLMHVFNFTATCPDCVGFLGLAGGEEMGDLTAENLYSEYEALGYALLTIYSGTEDFVDNKPTAADCAAMEAQVMGRVVFDSTGTKAEDVLGLLLKGGSALVAMDGRWVTAPPGKDVSAQEGGIWEVVEKLETDLAALNDSAVGEEGIPSGTSAK